MSFLKRMFTCPCKTRACRIMRAKRALLVLIAGALITGQALIMTNAIHDPIGGETPAGTSWIAPQALTVMQAAAQLELTSITTTATITAAPGQEWAACTGAAGLRSHQLEHAHVPSSAWWSTWKAADHADPEMRQYIHVWMLTGRAWWRVRLACNPDA